MAMSMVLMAADGAVVGGPLHGMGCARRSEPRLNAFDHQVADHLAGDPGGGGDPAQNLTVVAVERERDPRQVAIPAGELERVGAPAGVGAQGDDLAIMLARPPPSGVPGQEQSVFLHQPVDAFGIDRLATVGSPARLMSAAIPPVAVGWLCVDEATDFGREFEISRAVLWSPFATPAGHTLGDVGPGQAERVGDDLHREPPRGAELDSEIAFLRA
jgi:hypothetical protein